MASFKDAADALCLSPSAVSHQIRDLESYLGVRLFERNNRAIVLTQRGRAYYEKVAPALTAIERATEGMRKTPERIQLRIQMPEFFASELFVPQLAGFSERHGDIDLRIDSSGPNEAENPNADVHIVLTRRLPEYPLRERLFPIRYVPACSSARHGCLAPIGPKVLESATLLLHEARPHAWQQWAELAGVPAPHPRQMIRLDSMFALARAAEQGAGIALIPMPISGAWFESGSLKRLFEPDLTTQDYYWVAARQPGRQPRATALLIRWIVETFADFA
jgi:LysR family glycine cleavage system transcriptional activator